MVGALDTKSEEYTFVKERLAQHGVPSLLVDIGVLGEAGVAADVDRGAVALAGDAQLADLLAAGDRGTAMTAMAAGAAAVLRQLQGDGQVSGVAVLGGSNAGFVMSRLAAALPIGFPKLLVSTIVAGDTRPYLQESDLLMMYPVVDLAGLNTMSRSVLTKAADAMAGMVAAPPSVTSAVESRSVGCSMFGVTTPCVTALQRALTARDLEVQVFHANGTGGRTLERLVRAGLLAAVADVTTTELADELVGGVCSAGADRLTAAAECGVPQVVSVGALDMVNFGPRATVPERYADRLFVEHNPNVTLMRTTSEECARLGAVMAAALNRATAFVEVHVPARGFSQIATPGGPFHDPDADLALIDTLRATLDPGIPLYVHDAGVNDAAFVQHLADALDRALDRQKRT